LWGVSNLQAGFRLWTRTVCLIHQPCVFLAGVCPPFVQQEPSTGSEPEAMSHTREWKFGQLPRRGFAAVIPSPACFYRLDSVGMERQRHRICTSADDTGFVHLNRRVRLPQL